MSLASVIRRARVNAKAFDPLDIGPDAFWRASDLGLADGTAVGSWTDLTSNARVLAQATVAKKPINKTAILNGLAVVRFAVASSQSMQVASYYPGNGGAGTDLTVFAVAKQDSSQAAAVSICSLRRGTSGWNFRYNATTSNQWSYGTLGATPASKADSITTTNWNLMTLVRTGLSASLAHNGSSFVTQTFSAYTAQSSTGLIVGGEDTTSGGVANASFVDMDLAELVIFTRALTLPEVKAYGHYVRDRYGLTVA
jgi:hypothetical protein